MDRPVLTLPRKEAAILREAYAKARVILEYGSGGSTVLAAEMPGKLIFSVESDRDWAVRLQAWVDAADLPSGAILWPVDIGETGRWGRPVDETGWRNYHRYPHSIWLQPFFRHPDVILIDGRFRAACLIACCMRVERPTTVLFDDYATRPIYHEVEQLVRPVRIVGRLAEFHLQPTPISSASVDLLLEAMTQATFEADNVDYSS